MVGEAASLAEGEQVPPRCGLPAQGWGLREVGGPQDRCGAAAAPRHQVAQAPAAEDPQTSPGLARCAIRMRLGLGMSLGMGPGPRLGLRLGTGMGLKLGPGLWLRLGLGLGLRQVLGLVWRWGREGEGFHARRSGEGMEQQT